MTAGDFIYRDNFPSLTDMQINQAISEVSAMFSGVLELWGVITEPLRSAKRKLCLNLLVGWYLMDTKPSAAIGVMGSGGMAISSKSIGGTSLSITDMEAQEGLKQLNSNVFGQKALMMIQGAPERHGIYA